MVWVRLYDSDAPEGEEVGPEFEISALPDAGDRIVLQSHEGDIAVFDVVGRTFEVAFDEKGDTQGEARVTLEVERLEAVPDDEEDEEDEEEPRQGH
jgi:hypothetical protein